MRGYFAMGVEGGNKVGNLGNLTRSAYAFGASFFFTVGSEHFTGKSHADTASSTKQVPLYQFDGVNDLLLPKFCALVGVELTDEAIDLPSFAHPKQAAYVLGPERGSLSPEMVDRCDHIVRIPTSFCLNQATAGAVIMYDRIRMLGRWPARPVSPFSEPEELPEHTFGEPMNRTRKAER